jgi:hypothetical protein
VYASIDLLAAARAEALFASSVSAWAEPTDAEVAAASRHAVRTHGGTRGCAGTVAAAYGDCPETALPRMRWARRIVQRVYPRPRDVAGRRTPVNRTAVVARTGSCKQRGHSPVPREALPRGPGIVRYPQPMLGCDPYSGSRTWAGPTLTRQLGQRHDHGPSPGPVDGAQN